VGRFIIGVMKCKWGTIHKRRGSQSAEREKRKKIGYKKVLLDLMLFKLAIEEDRGGGKKDTGPEASVVREKE